MAGDATGVADRVATGAAGVAAAAVVAVDEGTLPFDGASAVGGVVTGSSDGEQAARIAVAVALSTAMVRN
jgi:hypothetical protein